MMTSSNGNISTLLAFWEGNPPVTGGFPLQRPVTWSFDVFFDLCLNKRLNKQLARRWFETPLRPILRHCNGDNSTNGMEIMALRCTSVPVIVLLTMKPIVKQHFRSRHTMNNIIRTMEACARVMAITTQIIWSEREKWQLNICLLWIVLCVFPQ